jgi:hypothetical protein
MVVVGTGLLVPNDRRSGYIAGPYLGHIVTQAEAGRGYARGIGSWWLSLFPCTGATPERSGSPLVVHFVGQIRGLHVDAMGRPVDRRDEVVFVVLSRDVACSGPIAKDHYGSRDLVSLDVVQTPTVITPAVKLKRNGPWSRPE